MANYTLGPGRTDTPASPILRNGQDAISAADIEKSKFFTYQDIRVTSDQSFSVNSIDSITGQVAETLNASLEEGIYSIRLKANQLLRFGPLSSTEDRLNINWTMDSGFPSASVVPTHTQDTSAPSPESHR